MTTVGIPRALLFYQYFPMWKTFFEALGAEVVVSSPTTRGLLSAGSERTVAETCLPVKVFCGHILSLAERCDYVFVPAIRSLEPRVYNCSKFLGLPDLVNAVVPDGPTVLDVDIDINKGQRGLYMAVYKLARRFTWRPWRVRAAAEAAWETHQRYVALMREEHLSAPQALRRLLGDEVLHSNGSHAAPPDEGWPEGPGPDEAQNTIAVIGHPYIIYDEYITHKLVRRLQEMDIHIVAPEMASEEDLRRGVESLIGAAYWTYEDEVTGAGGHFLNSGVDGVISVTAFGCGPDSVMVDVVQRYARRRGGVPFMALTVDEHTGEAGLVTRLEAYVDMLRRHLRSEAAARGPGGQR